MEDKKLEGLGGWLILVGFGVIFAPLRIATQMLPLYLNMFSDGTFAAVTTPGTEAYNPIWKLILLGEMTINIGLILAWLYICFLFFSKRTVFPKWFITISLFTLSFIVLDAFAIKMVLPEQPIFDAETLKELMRSLISSCIWVPYMLVSKRVKATFVK